MKKKILIIIFGIIFSILIFFSVINLDPIKKVYQRIIEENEENIFYNGISYVVYDNASGYLKTLVKIVDEDGIDTIEYFDRTNNLQKISFGGKKEISLDIGFDIEKDYIFNIVTSNGISKTETINIPSNYIDRIIDQYFYTRNSTTEIKEGSIEKEYYESLDKTVTYYYKIGNIERTGTTNDKIIPDLECFDYDDVLDNNIIVNVSGYFQDYAKNKIVFNDEEIEFASIGNFDVFNDVRLSGKSLNEYGFTASWYRSEATDFAIGNFSAGHWNGYLRGYSGTFELTSPKLNELKPAKLRTITNQWSSGAIVTTRATVYYTDGTSASVTSPTKSGGNNWSTYTLDLNLNLNKEIAKVQFYIWGEDYDFCGSRAYISSIKLLGINIQDSSENI